MQSIKLAILCLLFAGALSAAQTKVQSKTCNTAATPSTTLNCTFTSNVTATNLIGTCAHIYNFDESITAVTTDDKSNSYSIADTANQGTAPHVKTVCSYAKNVASGSTQVTITVSTSTYIDVTIWEISGSDTTAPLDQHCNSATTSSSPTDLSGCAVTTTTADEFILSSYGADGSTTWSGVGSYTLGESITSTATNVITFGDVYRIVSSTATYTPQVAISNTQANGFTNVTMTFKAAAGGGGTTSRTPARGRAF